jgi:acyl-[acyl-carrier-protein] desaturase
MSLQREILQALDPMIAAIHEDHLSRQKLWMPTEVLHPEYRPAAAPPEVTAMLVLNLLTEDGLPYFLALLVDHLGSENAIWSWSRTWTAEEDRHGSAIKQYLHLALTREQMIAVETMQYHYLSRGFWPQWGKDPLKLFAYVVLQEKATQTSHGGIADKAKSFDPTLASMMRKIAAEESKHYKVYFRFFEAAMKLEPNAPLQALASVVRSFAMPGASIDQFDDFARLQSRLEVFGPHEFADLIDNVAKRLQLATLGGLTPVGEVARDTILKTPGVLRRAARKIKQEGSGEFSFSFLPSFRI